METTASFGYWVRRRRKALDLTQQALADRVGCSLAAIKKIETDQRQPSQQLAERMADCLNVPASERAAFLARARGLLLPEELSPAIEPSTPTAPAHPAPAEPTSFVGRVAELGQIAAYLADPGCRLLTLVGQGGIGKTRLALRAAAQAQFAHGVCFVALADISTPELVAPAIAQRLGVQTAEVTDPEIGLVAFLRSREILLVLDNFEQLLAAERTASDGPVSLLIRIIDACPRVKLLVTARERLNLQAEWLLPLAGLPVEDAAVPLFVERARRVQPSFALTGQEAAVAEICRLVEGMPLAVELAAGWAHVLSCEQIAQHIRQNVDFLATRLRDVPERHRSLRALFDGSWRLLTDDQRYLLMRLSVFHGGFTADAAAVLSSEFSVLSSAEDNSKLKTQNAKLLTLLAPLVEKSLVSVDPRGRYDLHELARRYAAGQLAASGAAEAVRRCHFEVYLALAETAAAHFSSAAAPQWFERLEREQGNLGAAWDWAVEQADTATLYRLVRPLGRFWIERGAWREGAARLQQVLARTEGDESPQRALAMCIYGTLLTRSGRPLEALPYMVDGYSLAERGADDYVLGMAAMCMSQVASEPAQRLQFCRQAIELFRKTQHRAELAITLWLWGDELRAQAELEQARAAYAESLQLYRGMGNLFDIVYPLGNLGRLALLEGDVAGARRSFAECVELARRTGNSISLADWLVRLGSVVFYQGELEPARAALQEALNLAQELGHSQIVPNVLTWLALVAVAESDLDHASQYVQQSLDDYTRRFVMGHEAQMRDTQYRERPDFLEALIAAAQVHTARRQLDRAAIVLSFAARIQREQGYRLDPPLQAIVDDLCVACRAGLGSAAFAAAWEAGQLIGITELLQLSDQDARSEPASQGDT
jgi:predicted ATPase/transcriptional regulator with XRE-family HTH domain